MNRVIVDRLFTKDKIIKVVDDTIDFIDITSKNEKSIVGNIYVGRIEKIINKNFAFINIGDEKNAFIDLSDIKENLNVDFENGKKLKIKQGDKIIVQILRDKTDEKGALATSQVNYKSENIVVFRALQPSVNVSKKIEDIATRKGLKDLGSEILVENFSVLFRTSCQDIDKDILVEEYLSLVKSAKKTEALAEMQKPPMLLKKINDYILDTVFRLLDDETEVYINDDEYFEIIKSQVASKGLDNNVVYEDATLINGALQKQVDKLFQKKIWLKSGGFLFIEQTEACVVVDVNTGKNIKTKNKLKLVRDTNIEALKEIAKQIKLRNLSGIIIVDLIDCKLENDLKEINKVAKKIFKVDSVPVNVVEITTLGLLEITRKKTSDSLQDKNSIECSFCQGTGKVLDYDYIIDKIFNEICWIGSREKIIVKVNKKVVDYISRYLGSYVSKLEERLSTKITFEQIETGRLDYYEFEF